MRLTEKSLMHKELCVLRVVPQRVGIKENSFFFVFSFLLKQGKK